MVRIALFGSGTCAERAATAIDTIPGLQLVGVADNAPAKQGTEWRGHKILSASNLVAAGGWDYVCVASQWHADIARQLGELGVPPTQIADVDELLAVHDGQHDTQEHAAEDTRPRPADPRSLAVTGFEGDFDRLKLLRGMGFNPSVVLDVGASNGVWSVTCARVFPEAHYYLVEPLPNYEGRWYTEQAASWHRIPVALGAHDGEATIEIPQERGGEFSATLLPLSSGGSGPDTQTLQVPVRRIDTLIADGLVPPPQLVKLDVQGYEAAVLAGGSRLWDSAEAFLVELSMEAYWAGSLAFPEMIALFAEHGFMPFDFFHEYRRANGVLVQIDCVFLRRDGDLARRRYLPLIPAA